MKTNEKLNEILEQMEADCKYIRSLIESVKQETVKLKNQKQ